MLVCRVPVRVPNAGSACTVRKHSCGSIQEAERCENFGAAAFAQLNLRMGATSRDVEASTSNSSRNWRGLGFPGAVKVKWRGAGGSACRARQHSCGSFVGPERCDYSGAASLINLQVGAVRRDVEASTLSTSSRAWQGLGSSGAVKVKRCGATGGNPAGEPEHDIPFELDGVSLTELLQRVGAGDPRNAQGRVQIEANPHPSVLNRFTELRKSHARGRTLPIPMPHKMKGPVPLPRSRRQQSPNMSPPPKNIAAAATTKSSNIITSSPSKQPEQPYPKLLAKLLVTSYDAMWTVLDAWKGKSKSRSDSVASLILRVGRMDSLDKALHIFAWVCKQPHLWPDDSILLAVLQIALESREGTLANNLLAVYGPLSPQSSYILANAYAEHGFVRDALQVLQSLETHGISGGEALYVKMVVRAGEAGAKSFVAAMLRGGNPCFHFAGNCTTVMATCSKLGLFEEVESLFRQHKEQGYVPNIVMFTILMQSRSRAGREREAISVFWEMEEAGVEPDLIAYRVMIQLCDKLGELGRAVKVYNKMKARGFVPTFDVYNVLIKLYCREGRTTKAREILREMKMWGFAPSQDIHQYLTAELQR